MPTVLTQGRLEKWPLRPCCASLMHDGMIREARMGQLGFFDADKRLAALSAKGDPLEAIDRLVPWERFRSDIEAVVLTPDEVKKSSAGPAQSVGRASGIPGSRPVFVHAVFAAGHRGQHSGRDDAVAVPREAGQGWGG